MPHFSFWTNTILGEGCGTSEGGKNCGNVYYSGSLAPTPARSAINHQGRDNGRSKQGFGQVKLSRWGGFWCVCLFAFIFSFVFNCLIFRLFLLHCFPFLLILFLGILLHPILLPFFFLSFYPSSIPFSSSPSISPPPSSYHHPLPSPFPPLPSPTTVHALIPASPSEHRGWRLLFSTWSWRYTREVLPE